jgi:hypothetical protein
MIAVYLYLYILGSSAFLPKITKTLTLSTLGIPPVHACCSSSSCLSPCAHFIACARAILSLAVTSIFAPFLSHDHPSFHFGLVPTMLMEKTRCMLSGARLGKEFWAEAVGIACYLVNKSPSSVLDDKTPQEVWIGKKPSLTHLKVFGCDAYVHVPKENRSKLDKKAEKCIFIGYKYGLKGYKL